MMSEVPAGLSDVQSELAQRLLGLGQGHLFVDWPAPGTQDDEKAAFMAQVDTHDYVGPVHRKT